jgi:hypothetical protein
MRVEAALVVAIWLNTVGSVRADGLVYHLPEDGTWARYSFKQTMAIPKEPKDMTMTVEGTLTLASVGQEKIKDQACRWIEIVIEVKPPGEGRTVKEVFKALIPENRLKKGENPLGHWVKGWIKLGDEKPQPLTKELLSNPALMINVLVTGPLQNTKTLEDKTIVTKLGKLTCEGVSGSLTLKGAAISVKNDQVTTGNVKVRVENYLHDKAPFGVVFSRLEIEFPDLGMGKGSAEADLTLFEVGTSAKSELPDQK